MSVLHTLGLAASTALIFALAGCGRHEPSSASKSATVQAWVRSYPGVNQSTGKPVDAIDQRVVIQVRPHCVDGSQTLDCDGIYSFAVEYRFREGQSNALRCIDLQDSVFQFVGAAATRVRCDDTTPGKLSAQATTAMAGETSADAANAAGRSSTFRTTTRFTVDAKGVQRYEWRSRDGARCTGHIATPGSVTRTRCRWH